MQPVGSENDKFETIVVPAREEGFKQRFLNEHCWFAVRINARHISKLKFIAAYQVAAVAAITHIAEIDAIVPDNDTGKYLIKFKGAATAIVPIPRPEKQRGQYAVVALRALRQVAGSEEPGSGVGMSVVASTPMKTTKRHKTVDWESGALFWNCRRDHDANWEVPFRAKLEEDLGAKDLMFLMGNQHRFQDQWLIISLVYPPKRKPVEVTQGSLF